MIDLGIEKVFRTFREHGVQCLLSGGQACIFYGAAEFSKDVDFVVLADSGNFERLEKAADALAAETIAVPPFDIRHFDEGLAVHLRCTAPPCNDLLWERRTVIEFDDFAIDLLGVRDLIASKKTQRAKDWPMIQRLVEVHFQERRDAPVAADIDLWLRELRTVELLLETASRFADVAGTLAAERPLLRLAIAGDEALLRRALVDEIEAEKERDRLHWEPLKARLGELRRAARQG
jgi:hypothetical protein